MYGFMCSICLRDSWKSMKSFGYFNKIGNILLSAHHVCAQSFETLMRYDIIKLNVMKHPSFKCFKHGFTKYTFSVSHTYIDVKI